MSASLWPALLAAFLGQSSSSSSGSGAEGGEPGVELVDRELAAWRRAWLPLHTLLAATLLGQHALYWWIGLLCFIGLAYATNPSEASFKTHLTDLSFHLHLRRLRAHELDSQATSTPPPPQSLPGDFHKKLSGSGGGAASSSASSRSASSSGGAIASQQALLAASTTSSGAGSANQAASIANGGKDASSLSHNGTSHLGQSASSSTSAHASSKSNSNNAAAKVKNSQQQQGSTSSITAGNSTLNAEHKARSAQTSAQSSFGGKAGGGGGSIGALRRHAHGNGEAGRPHILSFSNRVSISLRTPSYIRTSYGLWSTVRILPAQAASTSAPSNAAAKKAPFIAGRPPLLNGVPPVTRRASTTLTHYDNKGSKKSSSSHSNSNNKKGLVSTVAHGISSTLSSPVYTPWLEQGGYFIGFLGYWWTIDDGTSYTGAREKVRLNNALLAVEEQDDEDDVSVDHHASDPVRAHDDIEGGHNSFDHHSHNHRPEDHATHVNGNTHSNAGSIKRKHPSKTSTGASFRGGQRRSSPTPRQTQNNNKKRGSGSTVPLQGSTQSQHTSGDVTPVTPNSAIPVDRTAGGVGGRAAGDLRDDLLSTNADRNLPGLPFHVDHHHQDTNAGGVGSAADAGSVATGGQLGGSGGGSGDQQGLRSASDRGDAEKVEGDSEGEKLSKGDEPGGISTVSHSASAPEAAEPTVSPAVALLQGQLDDLRTTSATTQARLESEIEELQNRKRDEDAVRTELKSRTKALEETKREAETERLEAEKKLINARSQKKVVEDRVTKARSELTKLEKREKETQERLDKAREERRTKLDQLREDVRQREALLAKEEEATDKLSNRVEALEKEIEERKNDLFHFRREEANAAAMAVTNRMNRAGRGVSHAHAHAHATGPHSGAAATAKRHHPVPHAHSAHPAHRHPSQHPNAAVPIAYPYINAEDAAAAAAGKNQASTVRSSSPAGTPPAGSTQMSTGPGALASATSNASVVPTGSTAQPIGSSFLEHRLQARRANAAANMPLAGTGAQPVSSSMNTSVIGNSASAANALYNRQQLNGLHSVLSGGNNEDGSPTELDNQHSAIPGSTFAPFGPASPTSPATIGGTSPREGHGLNISPPLMHAPYFASDTAGSQSRLHASRSREDFLAGIRAGRDLHDFDATRLSPGQAHTPTLMPSTDLSGNFVDEEDSYMSAKLGGKKIERRESFGSTASFTSSNGGPLSPMTPHQASLIPSHLFDMLDEVEMPTSPSPYQSSGPDDQPHHAFTQGMMDVFDPSDTAGHLSDMPEHHSQSMLDASDDLTSTTTTAEPRRTSAMYSPWADFDMDAGFDFDKPLGFGKQQQFLGGSNTVSRKSSARDAFSSQRESLLHKRSGSPLNASLDSASAALLSNNNGPSQNDPVISTAGHGHHGSVGSIGQRSNTSSSVGQVSPSLAAATATGTASNAGLPSNAFGKMSPNDLLLDKARQALSLNPDAKAFSFKRPLPSSASAGSLHSIAKANGGLPSNAVGALGGDATRQAFDAAVGGPLGNNNNNNNHHTGGSGQESPILGAVSGGNATVVGAGSGAGAGGGGGTWASPNLGSRGLPAVSHLGYGHSAAGLRESVRSASGPPSSTAAATSGSNQGMHAGSSFSPFDDDDLLKGW